MLYTETVTSTLELRTATDDDYPELETLISRAFLDDPDDDTSGHFRKIFEPHRTQVVADDGVLVGTGGVLTRDLAVPGAVIPAAHVTAVAVASTHRRRGVLTSVMNAMLTESRERGTEPVAVLWASEGAIYGRFGYGLASWRVSYQIPSRGTALPGEVPDAVRLRHAVSAEAIADLRAVYDRVLAQRPGLSSRPGPWWEYLTADPKSWRRGMTAERSVFYEDDGGVRGYARYRTKSGWNSTGPDGEVSVTEIVAETPEAYAGLWRFLLSIDLVRTVRYGQAAVDDPLTHLVTNPDGLDGTKGGALWIRVLDVPGALTARRYAAPVDLVLDVSDSAFGENAGRWRLVGDSTAASCERTDAEPDLVLGIRQLGSLYLGGVSAGTLAAGGLITELTPGAVAAASAAFGWHRAPSTVEIF